MRVAVFGPACFAASLFTVAAVPSQQRGSSRCQAQVLSATVLATSCSHPDGDRQALDLFIMWRGSPGWFQRSENGVKTPEVVRDFALGKPGRVAQYRTYGDVTAGFDADFADRKVTIDHVAIPLVSHNAILVDHVDVPHIRGIATTFRVDTTLPQGADANLILARRSAAIRQALQCDISLPSAPSALGTPVLHRWHVPTVCDLLR
jgi:hypothetical protein